MVASSENNQQQGGQQWRIDSSAFQRNCSRVGVL